jgi:hypothetical protein
MAKLAKPVDDGSRSFCVKVSQAFLLAVDAWRREQPDIPTRSEAVRRMVLAHRSRASRAPAEAA